ncbi:hypothetical protein SAMN03159343_0358 [Klenkia marina]|uniref:DUF6542 domain-containing protein n=1 Tax=Klenkia marina TaxID=1960309 RepID=A0A1G4XBF5_9ACTN|nr:DUF6542 domain-containing protein [Klenkia marina]SCX38264.1 hypothetical protein SAMN03159343_0358 [Klenkia marina]
MQSERDHADQFRPPVPRSRSGAPAPRSRATGRAARDEWAEDADPRHGREPRASRDPRATRDRRGPAPARDQDGRRSARRTPAPQRGVRGALGVLSMFLLTLVGAAADSWLGVGLGTITTVALIASTVVAALVVRKRDLATVVVAPPLVYVGVAVVNIVLAPSATFSLATIATLLIRGFPAMAIAVAAALVLTVVRLIARR